MRQQELACLVKYLQHSIIYVTSRRNYLLLRIIFNLSSPIAPVYIVTENNEEFNRELNDAIINNTNLPKNVLKFTPQIVKSLIKIMKL